MRWAACKWGISQDIVFAQAAVESWWQQDELGDWGTQAGRCPPGHGRGADGRPGACPESYGILQDKYPLEQPSWPGIGKSTAMNADVAYAIWRSCYDGYEVWLNDEPKGRLYRAGDVWGCVGRWNTGSWYTPHAEELHQSGPGVPTGADLGPARLQASRLTTIPRFASTTPGTSASAHRAREPPAGMRDRHPRGRRHRR